LFIDRDPKYFSIILNFLRTKELNLNGVDISNLRHEAEFYGIISLVKRLILCEDLDRSLCGDVLFTGFIPTPILSNKPSFFKLAQMNDSNLNNNNNNFINFNNNSNNNLNVTNNATKPGNVLRINNTNNISSNNNNTKDISNKQTNSIHSRNSSVDYLTTNKLTLSSTQSCSSYMTHSRKSSNETSNLSSYIYSSNNNQTGNSKTTSHSRNQSVELKQIKTDLGIILTDLNTSSSNPNLINKDNNSNHFHVNLIVGHLNWISVAYSHFVCCYKLKDGMGWQLMFQSNYIEEEIERIAINSKHQSVSTATSPNINSTNIISTTNAAQSPISSNSNTSTNSSTSSNIGSPIMSPLNISTLTSSQNTQLTIENSKLCALLAISIKSSIRLWLVVDENITHLIGNFCLNANVDNLFFIGSQLVATSTIGKIGVWNSLSQLWQTQDITPISSFDTAGSFLLLGGQNGVLYYIDMQKFPLRMKDNDLLVTELYKDPLSEAITALSVYLTPKTTNTGNWIEIAYGTNTGQVRVIVQHPETVGHGPQLFQSFSVHRGSIVKVMLTEKHLVSVCSESFHVRTWK
jgi:hypothetical protein